MHVFLSPHMDDTTFSCGGLIHKLTTQGEAVHVINVMAGDPPLPLPESPLVRELHQRWQAGESPAQVRRLEEEKANSILGATVEFWQLPDCIYRTASNEAIYTNGDDDLFGPVHPADPAHDWLRTATLPRADALYIPAGMGNHVDHVLVRDWALAQGHPNSLLYADYPYARDPAAQTAALNIHPPHILENVIACIDDDNFNAKVQAISAYQSQLSTFWRDAAHMRDQLAQDMRHPTHPFAEPYWRLLRTETGEQ